MRSQVTDVIVTYCLLELRDRGHRLDFVTYESVKASYKREDFIMQVPGIGGGKIGEMNPVSGKIARIVGNARSEFSAKICFF